MFLTPHAGPGSGAVADEPRRVKVSRAGLDGLRDSRQVIDQMWKGLDRDLRGSR
jgi:hypothetical protein